MAGSWPWSLCDIILDSYQLTQSPNVRRTEFDDGIQRQTSLTTRTYVIRSFQVAVLLSNFDEFRTWIKDVGSDFFSFTDWWDLPTPGSDPGGSNSPPTKQVRIVDGAGSITFSLSNQLHRKERFFTADIVLEGFE